MNINISQELIKEMVEKDSNLLRIRKGLYIQVPVSYFKT